jgi:hypothetical protein
MQWLAAQLRSYIQSKGEKQPSPPDRIEIYANMRSAIFLHCPTLG